MREAKIIAVLSALLGAPAIGQSDENSPPSGPPGGGPARVVVNSQQSLADAVGEGFRDQAWEYPRGLLPREFLGLTYVSGPGDPGLSLGKGAWRKPVVLRNMDSRVELSVNCYRRREARVSKSGGPGTAQPPAALEEFDYRYKPTDFHNLRAAAASERDCDVFVFRDGDLLFKVEAVGGKPEARREAATAVAEAIWKFRHPKQAASDGK